MPNIYSKRKGSVPYPEGAIYAPTSPVRCHAETLLRLANS